MDRKFTSGISRSCVTREMNMYDSSYGETRNPSMTSGPKLKQRTPPQRDPRLVFAVQKHKASHLHYDLRLEVHGSLKSWVVPNGLSMDPGEERLAIETESPAFGNKDIEGKIPANNPVAGSVIVWDKGWYEPVGPGMGPNDRIVRGLRRGAIRFVLHGQRLKGGFSMVRFRPPDQWLLTKRDDIFAQSDDS